MRQSELSSYVNRAMNGSELGSDVCV